MLVSEQRCFRTGWENHEDVSGQFPELLVNHNLDRAVDNIIGDTTFKERQPPSQTELQNYMSDFTFECACKRNYGKC